MSWIGRSLPRIEDPALLRGEGRFTADLAEGALRVAFVRSPVACGQVLGIDAPEGARVWTQADMGEVRPIRPRLFRPDYVAVGQPVLAGDRVHFAGQAVAMVVAEGTAMAEDLAEQVFLDIEAEAPVIGIEAALAPGARSVHPEAPGNVLVEGQMRSAGLDSALAAAAHVVTVSLRSGRQSAMPLETRGGVARFDRTDGRVTLHASVQMPHMLRTGIADTLGMREDDLRVVAPDVGGGFGQKMSLFPEYVALVWLARHLRRDVAWIEDRRENFLASAHSRDQSFTLRGGFDAEGRLTGLEADLISDVGAFSCYPVTCGVEPLMAFAELPGPYVVPEYGVRSRGVATNACMMAPYRGVSRPNLTLAMERMMDKAARALGIAPEEIRRRNLVTVFPHRSPTGLVHDEGSYVGAMELGLELFDVAAFRARQRSAREAGRYLGLGLSVFSERSGYGTPAFAARAMEIVPGYETVECSMDPSGNVELRIGASPHGQGLKTSLGQLVADEMGVTPDRVRVISGDTDAVPYGWGTFASRSMVISGGACKRASSAIAVRLRSIAAQMLEVPPESVKLENGTARSDASNMVLDIGEIARAAYHQSHRFPEAQGGLRQSATYDPAGTFSNACHIAEVEVDVETGQVTIDRFLVVEDAGVLVNPMIVDGQIHGGVAQGIANALYEEVIYDADGNLLTASLADFLVPTLAEIPDIEIAHLQTETDASETRAKGVGEGGTIGAPAALLNAINDALVALGASIERVPATPERIRAAIRAATGGT